jgi:hypothetical protein
MYRRTVVLCTWSVALLTCAFSAVLINRNLSARAEQTVTQSRPAGKARNLSLQPEAFKMSRRLGSRFMPSRQSTLTMLGTLTPGSVQQNLSITRRQTATGEEVGIAGEAGTLAWSDLEGARASGANLSEAQQTLIERIVLDNPDQFVLAQLRGASYYTVAHNVRADVGGSDNYNGPLWNLVRVDEPATEVARPSLSNSRLYYINVQTGLIDKIVCELKGATIEASILQWVDQGGEKLPSHIVWKRGNETVQEFRLSSVSIQPQQ